MGTMHKITSIAILALLLGCGSSRKEAAVPMTPPEALPEEETRIREFEFGVGDEIDVFVWRHPNFSRRAIVNPDGNISFAILGEVKVAGLMYDEFYDELMVNMRKYLRNPKVAVNVITVSDEKVYVLGWVRRPGVYIWNSQMSVVEAIARAGGIVKDTAGPRTVFIASGDAENPELRIVDYLDIMREGKMEDNIPLQRGDIVYVPKQFMGHVDKFFQRYGSYISAIREGMWALEQYPDVQDAVKGDASKRLDIITKNLEDTR